MNGLRARFCALVAQQLRAPLPAGKKGAKDRGVSAGCLDSTGHQALLGSSAVDALSCRNTALKPLQYTWIPTAKHKAASTAGPAIAPCPTTTRTHYYIQATPIHPKTLLICLVLPGKQRSTLPDPTMCHHTHQHHNTTCRLLLPQALQRLAKCLQRLSLAVLSKRARMIRRSKQIQSTRHGCLSSSHPKHQ